MKTEYFDKEKQEKALKWLNEKWENDKRACECCGNKEWQLAKDLVMPPRFEGDNLVIWGNCYPHLLITCLNCGNSKLFSAVLSGVVVKKPKDKEKEKIIDKKIKIFCLLLMLIIIYLFSGFYY